VSILHHRRHELQNRNIASHIPLVAEIVTSPLSPAAKYASERVHEALVEPSEVQGNTIVFELQSPDGEKRACVVDRGLGERY
jgi:hypothetical protein